MALLICSECEGKVSSLAASCPHCGAPVPKSTATSTASAAASASTSPRPASPTPSSTSPDLNKAAPAAKQPLPLNVPLRTYRGQSRAVSVPLLLGIFFLPFIFSWFLLQKGYSQVARVAGFAWLIFVAFILFGMLRLMSDLFWSAPVDPNLSANGTVTTQPLDGSQTPVSQQPLRPLTLPTPQVQNNPVVTQTPDTTSPQIQPAQDPIQFNQASPPPTIDSAANSAANPGSSDNNVNPFNDTRPIHSNDAGSTQ